MAKTAFWVINNKTLQRVDIDSITDSTRHNRFICDGKCEGSGELCGAPVSAVIRGPRHCFRISPGFRHKKDCPNDESETAVIRRHLDVTGNTTSVEELLSAFASRETHRGGGVGMARGGERGIDPERHDGEEDMADDRAIVREARNPRTLRELCALLSRCEPDDTYAGIRVADILIDHRSIENVRANGMKEGQIAVVLCRKVGAELREKLAPEVSGEAVVLVDAYAYPHKAKPTAFIIPCSLEARNKIIKENSKKNIIAIMGKWYQDPLNEGAYVCNRIEAGQVFRCDEGFFE